jgi:protein involved in polysaccharide export with SLBB domain
MMIAFVRPDLHRRAWPWHLVLGCLFLCFSLSHAGAQDAAPAAAAVRAAHFSVQPGDKVRVKVSREPELTDSVLVNSEGDIVLGRIGAVHAATLSIAALTDTVRARYGRFLRNPAVELVVLRRIAVNGEVFKPDVYYVDVSATLRDVIARAGGITADGSEQRVDIVRRGTRTRIANWQDDFSLASDLQSGDQIVVGRRSWISRNAFSAISAFGLIVSLYVTLRR